MPASRTTLERALYYVSNFNNLLACTSTSPSSFFLAGCLAHSRNPIDKQMQKIFLLSRQTRIRSGFCWHVVHIKACGARLAPGVPSFMYLDGCPDLHACASLRWLTTVGSRILCQTRMKKC